MQTLQPTGLVVQPVTKCKRHFPCHSSVIGRVIIDIQRLKLWNIVVKSQD